MSLPIFEKIETYSVAVGENDLGNTRIIRLKLETGGMGFIDFTEVLPPTGCSSSRRRRCRRRISG